MEDQRVNMSQSKDVYTQRTMDSLRKIMVISWKFPAYSLKQWPFFKQNQSLVVDDKYFSIDFRDDRLLVFHASLSSNRMVIISQISCIHTLIKDIAINKAKMN